MANTLPEANTCCDPCESPLVTNVAGPTGATGAAGTNGTNGTNAFTTTNGTFVMPAVAGTVTITVLNTQWGAQAQAGIPGQVLYIEFAGYMEITAILTATTMTVKNLGYTGNAAPAVVIPTLSRVGPGGLKGVDGSLTGAASGDLGGTYPSPTLQITTTKGDIIARHSTANARLAVGANGTRLVADSVEATGVKWAAVNVASAAEVTGALAIVNGGTAGTTQATGFNNLSPLTTKGDVVVHDGGNNIRVAVGSNGKVITADSTAASGLKWAPPYSIAIYEDQQTNGTAGGTFTAGLGTWQTRVLNMEVTDPDSIGTLAANQITLGAGTYRVRGICPAYKVDAHQCRIRNITDGTTAALGVTNYTSAAGAVVTFAEVEGRFSIGGSKAFELQHTCATTRATDGFGIAGSLGDGERYAKLVFYKEP